MSNQTLMVGSIVVAWVFGYGVGQVFHYLKMFVKKVT